MTEMRKEELATYYHAADSWSEDRARQLNASQRLAYIVAAVASGIAILEAIALVLLTPLKTVVPYTLLVDRQTGYVQALDPTKQQSITPDSALVRSFLVQYVAAREGFDGDSVNDSYRKVALWSAGDARARYLGTMQSATNPANPLVSLPRNAVIDVQIRSISSLDNDSALVRFSTARSDPAGQSHRDQYWAAVIKYRFSSAAMSAADRLINPLGFQVVRYRRNAESLPETQPPAVIMAPPAVPEPQSLGTGPVL